MVVLDRKVQLVLPAGGRGATGGQTSGEPQVIMLLYAAMNDTGARAALLSGREDTATNTTWTINYRSDIDNRWRVVYSGISWRVVAALERGRREYLDLLCEVVK